MDIRQSILVLIVLLSEKVYSDSCQPIVDSLKNLGYVFTHNSICYVFINHEKTWVDARAQCETWGGDMVHIPDKDTMDFLRRVMGNHLRWRNNGVWIGLHNRGSGGWKWTTGDEQTYGYWEPGEPSKMFGFISFEDCACMRRNDDWRWHDYSCDNDLFTYKYICQFRMLTTTTTTAKPTTPTTSTVKPTTTTTVLTSSTTISTVKSVVYYKPSEATTSDAVHHVIIQGIETDSSLGIQVAQNIGGSNKDKGLSDSSKGAIIGLVLGGFIVLVVSCMVFILFRRRRRMKREADNLVVQFENTGYMHGYTQGYTPISQSEVNGQVRPESHMYMDTNEMNRLYEQVTKQVDHGVNNYDQLQPKTGACCTDITQGDTNECCQESNLKKKVDLPEESNIPSQMNNVNDYVDMGANKPKLTNLEVNTIHLEKQNNLQEREPLYSNDNIQRERLHTPTDDELQALDYEQSDLQILDYEQPVPVDKQSDPLYDVVD